MSNGRLMDLREARLYAYGSLIEAQVTFEYTGDPELKEEVDEIIEKLEEKIE